MSDEQYKFFITTIEQFRKEVEHTTGLSINNVEVVSISECVIKFKFTLENGEVKYSNEVVIPKGDKGEKGGLNIVSIDTEFNINGNLLSEEQALLLDNLDEDVVLKLNVPVGDSNRAVLYFYPTGKTSENITNKNLYSALKNGLSLGSYYIYSAYLSVGDNNLYLFLKSRQIAMS